MIFEGLIKYLIQQP